MQRRAQDPSQPRYHHFHPAAELIWFRRAEAWLYSRGQCCRTGTGDLVYLPSMTPHDFDVAAGETSFALIFCDPRLEQRLPPGLRAQLDGPRILTADPVQAARIDLLAQWLVDLSPGPTVPDGNVWTAGQVLDLLLSLVAQKARPIMSETAPVAAGRDPLVRLEKAIALVHEGSARPLLLSDAAAACNLSPAYFARLFRERMGQTFAQYQLAHRLNLAADLVATTDLGMAEIAWQSGFGSPAHLSARFAATFGVSPSRYRRAARAAASEGLRQQEKTSLSPS